MAKGSGDASDLMMMFVQNNKPVPAESQTMLISSGSVPNKLLKGFVPGGFFDVSRFTLKAGLVDQDKKNDKDKDKHDKDKKKKSASSKPGNFQGWRNGGHPLYPIDVQPVSFTRDIDRGSQIMMQNCIDCTRYDSATLIKRKAAGGIAAGEVFLRLDFVGVLVIGIDWSNEEEIEETTEFICRSVTINYKPQLPDGSLGAVVQGFWAMAPGMKPVTL